MPGWIQWGFWQWAQYYAAGSHKRTATDCQSTVKSARWETTSFSPPGKALGRNRWRERKRENEENKWNRIRGANSLTQRCWMQQSSGNHRSRLTLDDWRGSSVWNMNKTNAWTSSKVNTMQENMLQGFLLHAEKLYTLIFIHVELVRYCSSWDDRPLDVYIHARRYGSEHFE